MNQRRQGNAGAGRGQAPRQQQRAPQGDPTENEKIQLREAANKIMKAVTNRRHEIESVLPSNIKWDKFLATLTTALRHNPEILLCNIASIVQACCKAAYDGLLPDGVQAAFVVQNVKISGRNEKPERWEKQVRYNPMAYGFIKLMIESGAVTKVHSTLVYEGEPYKVFRGTEERLEHEEVPELRGPGKNIRAVYAVAWLPDGSTKFETMSKADVDAVREVAATQYVWNKNEGEMTRKTVIRRLRKSVPGTRELPDAEAAAMFPQFQDANAAAAGLPAPARPDRRDFGDQSQIAGPETYVDDFSSFDIRTGEVFAEQRDDQAEEQQQAKPAAKKAATAEKPAAEPAESDDAKKSDAPLPTSREAWEQWAGVVCAGLDKLPDEDAVNDQWEAQRELIEAAPKDLREKVNGEFRDRLTDIASGDAPAVSQGTLNIAGGDGN